MANPISLKEFLVINSLIAATTFSSAMYVNRSYDFNPKNVNKTVLEPNRQVDDYGSDYKNRYAILISGHNDVPFNEDMMEVYDSLKVAGYTDENIYVLASDRRSIPDDVFDLFSVKDNVDSVFEEVSDKITCMDSLFVYVSDHGLYDHYRKESYVAIADYLLYSSTIDFYMRDVVAKNVTLIVDACHTGEFSERVGKNNVVAVSSSSKYKISHKPSTFSKNVAKNYFEQDLDADANSDGKVSFEEAVDRAAKEDLFWTRVEGIPLRRFLPMRQCPQLQYQNVDPSEIYPE